MTVRELIEELEEYDEDMEVRVAVYLDTNEFEYDFYISDDGNQVHLVAD